MARTKFVGIIATDDCTIESSIWLLGQLSIELIGKQNFLYSVYNIGDRSPTRSPLEARRRS